MSLAATNIRNLKGERGGLYVTDTALHTFAPSNALGSKCWESIYAHTAAVVATAVSPNITGTLTAVAIPAGSTWYGRFSAVTLTSGTVTLYNAD